MKAPLFHGQKNVPLETLTANYHTHTARCHHAYGSERDYIERAIAAGMTTLGFSDHSPYIFNRGSYYSAFRMRPETLADYVDTLLSLREEYKGKIDILIGLEAEYYPAHFEDLLSFLSDYPMDYLILGQHFTDNEYDGIPSSSPRKTEEEIAHYVDQVIEGMKTGKFAYVAHPDVLTFIGDDDVYRRHMTRLCMAAKELSLPLEINFLGYMEGRPYPCDRFFRIVGEVGCNVVFGCDAHNPGMIPNPDALHGCAEIARKFGLKRTEEISLTLRRA